MIPNIFFGYYCLWGYPFMTSQKVANKWRSHFHHPQKLARDLLFKIMESANAWQILRTPLTSPFCVDIINVCFFSVFFFKFGLSNVWMQMKFWILWKFSQVISCQAIKETKQAYISNYISYFLNNFLVKFMSVTIIYVCYSWQNFVFEM